MYMRNVKHTLSPVFHRPVGRYFFPLGELGVSGPGRRGDGEKSKMSIVSKCASLACGAWNVCEYRTHAHIGHVGN